MLTCMLICLCLPKPIRIELWFFPGKSFHQWHYNIKILLRSIKPQSLFSIHERIPSDCNAMISRVIYYNIGSKVKKASYRKGKGQKNIRSEMVQTSNKHVLGRVQRSKKSLRKGRRVKNLIKHGRSEVSASQVLTREFVLEMNYKIIQNLHKIYAYIYISELEPVRP